MKYVYKNERVARQYTKTENGMDLFSAVVIATSGIYFLLHILVFTFK